MKNTKPEITEITCSGESSELLKKAIEIAMSWHTTATHYLIESKDGIDELVFYWSNCPNSIKLISPASAEELTPMIIAWLKTVKYPEEDDFDGSFSKGWKITSCASYEIFKVEPYNVYYGK